MSDCCALFGSSGPQQQEPPYTCHEWCTVDDSTINDLPRHANVTSPIEIFYACLIRGRDGEGPLIKGPTALVCNITETELNANGPGQEEDVPNDDNGTAEANVGTIPSTLNSLSIGVVMLLFAKLLIG